MSFQYKPEVLEELARHGVMPDAETPPELIREFINDLYLYEIRALRDKQRAGLIPKREYAGRVRELRERYPLLALPVRFWAENL
ncbi:MAG TPA: hypothetical protein VNO70_10890 [Blastocatellia bacterium]|nr:hypothetical protein [Blastocatellia bacterium]